MDVATPILEVRDLVVEYRGEHGGTVAVDHVALEVGKNEFLALVGESGCGKSTLCFAVARLLNPPAEIVSGQVQFHGTNLVRLSEKELRHIRWRDFSVVMQSAMNALNPVLTVGAQLIDAIRAHERTSAREARRRAEEVLHLVGIDAIHLRSYPHQLSGGMRQRAMIAMALVFTPDLIIMDEPTSALDVVAQRSLMLQIKTLQQKLGFAVIFVTHDVSLVSHFSNRVAIMYAGQVAELGTTQQVLRDPKHPYSMGLLGAYPSIKGVKQHLLGIPGSPPDLRHPPTGCRFNPRCPHVMPQCRRDVPPPYAPRGNDIVRCHLYAGEKIQDEQLTTAP